MDHDPDSVAQEDPSGPASSSPSSPPETGVEVAVEVRPLSHPHTRILATVGPLATRVAVVEDQKVVEIYVETPLDQSLVGNVYRGRVSNVATGLEAAFVDIGSDHDVFLPRSGVPVPESVKAQRTAQATETGAPERPVRIEDLLKVGQEVTVQIVKDPVGNKGARGTLALTLPGRYLVLTPYNDHVGVSRRITDDEERARLTALVDGLRPPGVGLIVRTASAEHGDDPFRTDLDELLRRWRIIQERATQGAAGRLLWRESTLVSKLVRDLMSPHVDEFLIDSAAEHKQVLADCTYLSDELRARIRLQDGAVSLFEQFGIEADLEKALDRRVWLKSGGTLVIDETEALHTIDVNTGRFLGSTDLEETAFKTNLEAAEAAARHVRLRNLAGIIVIDFIDMIDEDHKKKVVDRLVEAFRRDRVRTRILAITELGLVQMTRQRHRTSLSRHVQNTCPSCRGSGRVLTGLACAHRVLRVLSSRSPTPTVGSLMVNVAPHVAPLLLLDAAELLARQERRLGLRIAVRADATLGPEQYRIEEGPATQP